MHTTSAKNTYIQLLSKAILESRSHPTITVNKMPVERVVCYFWAYSFALTIPNNSGQSDSGKSDCRMMTYLLIITCEPRDESHSVHCSFLNYGYSMTGIECSLHLHCNFSVTDNQQDSCIILVDT